MWKKRIEQWRTAHNQNKWTIISINKRSKQINKCIQFIFSFVFLYLHFYLYLYLCLYLVRSLVRSFVRFIIFLVLFYSLSSLYLNENRRKKRLLSHSISFIRLVLFFHLFKNVIENRQIEINTESQMTISQNDNDHDSKQTSK